MNVCMYVYVCVCVCSALLSPEEQRRRGAQIRPSAPPLMVLEETTATAAAPEKETVREEGGAEKADLERRRQRHRREEAERLALEQTINSQPQRALPMTAPFVDPRAGTFRSVVHRMQPTDTLSGLAISYGVTEEQILEANAMLGQGRSVHAVKFLRIPLQDASAGLGGTLLAWCLCTVCEGGASMLYSRERVLSFDCFFLGQRQCVLQCGR